MVISIFFFPFPQCVLYPFCLQDASEVKYVYQTPWKKVVFMHIFTYHLHPSYSTLSLTFLSGPLAVSKT